MLYRRYVLPPLVDLVMRHRDLTLRRGQIIPRAHGRVVEIGIGSGRNLPFYGARVTHLVGVDPAAELLRQARVRAAGVAFPVEFHECSAEGLPLADSSIDSAVMTWTLCSIPRAEVALAELRRVLKPAGALLFAEHGLSPEPNVASWQRRLDPIWQRLAGGCHLNRSIDALIRGAGFDLSEMTTGYVPGPRLMAWSTFIYQGGASRA